MGSARRSAQASLRARGLPRWQRGRIILCHESVHRDAGEVVQERQNGFPDRTSNVPEIDVDPVWAGVRQALGEVWRAIGQHGNDLDLPRLMPLDF